MRSFREIFDERINSLPTTVSKLSRKTGLSRSSIERLRDETHESKAETLKTIATELGLRYDPAKNKIIVGDVAYPRDLSAGEIETLAEARKLLRSANSLKELKEACRVVLGRDRTRGTTMVSTGLLADATDKRRGPQNRRGAKTGV